MLESLIVAALLIGSQTGGVPGRGQPSTAVPAQTTLCNQALAGGITPAAAELCLGEQELREGEAISRGDADRSNKLRSAADHLRRGANQTSNVELKARGVDVLARLFDAEHLNEPSEEEGAIRELIGLRPNDLEPLFRLADLQEKQGQIDFAEDTLVGARRRQPSALEPYHRLARFYARRASTMQTPETIAAAATPAPLSDKPDQDGVYGVGGNIQPPRREGVPVYPNDAKAAGIEGVVSVEIVIGVDGVVTDARVVRSVPLLDAAALEAVQKWRFQPTLVNGTPVPVRLRTAVNFTTR